MPTTSSRTTLGAYLRTLRRHAGLTREGAAAASRGRVSTAYIGLLERGERRRPSVDKLRVLANVYGVPLRDLLAAAQDETLSRSVAGSVPAVPDTVTRLLRMLALLSPSIQEAVFVQVAALARYERRIAAGKTNPGAETKGAGDDAS